MKNLLDIREIRERIFVIRDEKVIIDRDLANLYGVTTKALNQAVKRNQKRFPIDFVFQLTQTEKAEVVTICDHLRCAFACPSPFRLYRAWCCHARQHAEQLCGCACEYSGDFRAFVRMRHILALDKGLARRIEQLEKKVDLHDTDIRLILQDIRKLLSVPEPELPARDIPKIRGFSKD